MGPELLKEVQTDACGENCTSSYDSGKGVEAIGIPDAMRNDWTREVGNDGSEGEETVAVAIVASGKFSQ